MSPVTAAGNVPELAGFCSPWPNACQGSLFIHSPIQPGYSLKEPKVFYLTPMGPELKALWYFKPCWQWPAVQHWGDQWPHWKCRGSGEPRPAGSEPASEPGPRGTPHLPAEDQARVSRAGELGTTPSLHPRLGSCGCHVSSRVLGVGDLRGNNKGVLTSQRPINTWSSNYIITCKVKNKTK